MGTNTAYWSTTGVENTYIGYTCGVKNSTGSQNAFYGFESGLLNEAGTDNTFIGKGSGYNNINGTGNVYVGSSTGQNVEGSGNVFIGYQSGSQASSSNINNRLFIHNSSGTTPLIYGEFDNQLLRINAKVGIGRISAANSLEVEGEASKTTATAWLANSDKRIKTDILDIDNAFETILKLRPVKFKYTNEYKLKHPIVKDKYYYNFIAQEFQEVFPESVKGSGEYVDGTKEEILQLDSYNAQIVSIKAVQELILENQQQQKEIEALRAELEALKKLIQK
jgi:hypothetical protein